MKTAPGFMGRSVMVLIILALSMIALVVQSLPYKVKLVWGHLRNDWQIGD
jgi:hypothetical protein